MSGSDQCSFLVVLSLQRTAGNRNKSKKKSAFGGGFFWCHLSSLWRVLASLLARLALADNSEDFHG
jgi:hypothetical protein